MEALTVESAPGAWFANDSNSRWINGDGGTM